MAANPNNVNNKQKLELTKKLWEELTQEGNLYGDFEENRLTRERARARISDYYEAVAKASRNTNNPGLLRANDFNEIVAFFKERLKEAANDPSKLNQLIRAIAMLVYYETWFAEEGWLRQDWSLAKLLLKSGFFNQSLTEAGFIPDSAEKPFPLDREQFSIDIFKIALMPEESVLSFSDLVIMGGEKHLLQASTQADFDALKDAFLNKSLFNAKGGAFQFAFEFAAKGKMRDFTEKELSTRLIDCVKSRKEINDASAEARKTVNQERAEATKAAALSQQAEKGSESVSVAALAPPTPQATPKTENQKPQLRAEKKESMTDKVVITLLDTLLRCAPGAQLMMVLNSLVMPKVTSIYKRCTDKVEYKGWADRVNYIFFGQKPAPRSNVPPATESIGIKTPALN